MAVEPAPSIPFPVSEPEVPETVALVPVADDDLPSDNNELPFIEVGGPRPKPAALPELVAPRLLRTPHLVADVSFHLMPTDAASKPANLGPELIAYHKPEHPVSRQYRRMVDGISSQHQSGRTPVLLFAPVSPRSSTVASVPNLAVTRAADGLGRVLVIEIERANGTAGACFGVPVTPGLREILVQAVPLGLAVHRTSVEGLYLVPAGRAAIGSDEANRLAAALDQLRARFDWIFVEAPTWGTYPLGDWAKASDSVYLILKQDEWDSQLSDAAHEGIVRSGGRLRGCITSRE